MPNNKQPNTKVRSINKRLNSIDTRMKSLYQNTYKTRVDNSENMGEIIDSIDTDIDDLLSKINSRSAYDISNAYLRLQRKNGASIDQINASIDELINNNELLNFMDVEYMSKSIQAEDYQYDLLCKYMPEIDRALEIKKDCVLSSDNFTKDFVNVVSGRTGKEFLQQFNDNANLIKDKYEFQDLCEEIYDDCSHYGEYFLYCVPYKKAMERLLRRKSRYGSVTSGIAQMRFEQTMLLEGKTLSCNEDYSGLDNRFINQIDESFGVRLEFNHTGLITSAIEEIEVRNRVKKSNTSLLEEYIMEASGGKPVDNLELGPNRTLISPDGFIDKDTTKKDKIKDIPGAVLEKIPRDEIFPVCIGDDTVLGYLHLEVKNDYITGMVTQGRTFNSLSSNRSNTISDEMLDQQNNIFLAQIANQMSQAIDAQFINANVDIKEEIYSILRYNDKFCASQGLNNIIVTFLPAEDVMHFYFKKDKKTHRGISDLKKSLTPGMIYCLLYLSDTIAKISRSYDKRLYYVKQNVETNVARTLQNTLIQIKRGNMGMRQLQNMNSMFNLIGRFSDHLIPVGPSDDPPIRFEVMQGQNIETPTELMDRNKEAAIETTDIPFEWVQSSMQVDFATRFTMSSSRTLRTVFKRQRVVQKQYSELFTRVYNYEFLTNEQTIKIMLPAPTFLTMNNTQQLIDGVRNYAQAIVDFSITDSTQEELKAEVIRNIIRSILGTYIDFEKIDNFIVEAKHALLYNKVSNKEVENDSSDSSEDYSDY